MKETIYIVGATTGVAKNNFPAFELAEKELSALGYNVLNPHSICEKIPRQAYKTEAEYMEHCERMCMAEMLGFAQFIVTISGWEYCRRAQKEVGVARQTGFIQVFNLVKILADAAH